MAVIYSPETAHAKEMWKWDHTIGETHPQDPTIRGMRPMSPQEYPKMLYKGGRTDGGPVGIIERCIVESTLQQRNMESRGFCERQEDAMTSAHQALRNVAAAAAELNYDVRHKSGPARREAEAVIAESEGHIGEIPAPKKRPGRPRKAKTEQVD